MFTDIHILYSKVRGTQKGKVTNTDTGVDIDMDTDIMITDTPTGMDMDMDMNIGYEKRTLIESA